MFFRTMRRVSPPVRALCAIALSLTVSACSMFGEEVAEEEPPVENLYSQADAELNGGNERKAAELFDEVERLYPTSRWAKRAIIMSAYASYEYGDYDKAALTAQRFLEFYPSDKDAPYAQYLIALSHYDQITDVGRDQARTQLALQSLRELINRYPNSEYAREAKLKLDLTLDHLAGKEMEVGRYYLKRR
ncbi:MAG: outer membrane protein assembly factor BamD, partial [Pseudomonadota bacterium]